MLLFFSHLISKIHVFTYLSHTSYSPRLILLLLVPSLYHLSLTHYLPLSLSHTLFISLSIAFTDSLSLTLTLSLTTQQTHTHSHTYTHTHTHTHRSKESSLFWPVLVVRRIPLWGQTATTISTGAFQAPLLFMSVPLYLHPLQQIPILLLP